MDNYIEKIPGAVEKALSEGIPEETFFNTEHQCMLMDAYQRVMKIADDESCLQKVSIANLPSLEPDIDEFFAPVQIMAVDHIHLFKSRRRTVSEGVR